MFSRENKKLKTYVNTKKERSACLECAKETMKELLKKTVEETFGVKTEYYEKPMNNGGTLLQLTIQPNSESAGISLYVDPILANLESGLATMNDILRFVEQCLTHELPKDALMKYLKKKISCSTLNMQ